MRWVARVFRLLLAAGMSLYLWHDGPFRPEYLLALTAAVLLGEFLLPLFFHRPTERYELSERVRATLPLLQDGPVDDSWVRIVVLEEDVPTMTWVGFFTVLVNRGCYNLSASEFCCALQEAYEQRRNLRSVVLLLATVGNPVFLSCRVFCLAGWIVVQVVCILIAALVSLLGRSNVLMNSMMGSQLGRGLYQILGFAFLWLGDLSCIVCYFPMLLWADWETDHTLVGYGMGGVLLSLLRSKRAAWIDRGRMNHPELSVLLRLPAALRRRIAATTEAQSHVRRTGGTVRGETQERPASEGRSGAVIPEGMRRPAAEKTPTAQGRGKIHSVKVTKSDPDMGTKR